MLFRSLGHTVRRCAYKFRAETTSKCASGNGSTHKCGAATTVWFAGPSALRAATCASASVDTVGGNGPVVWAEDESVESDKIDENECDRDIGGADMMSEDKKRGDERKRTKRWQFGGLFVCVPR